MVAFHSSGKRSKHRGERFKVLNRVCRWLQSHLNACRGRVWYSVKAVVSEAAMVCLTHGNTGVSHRPGNRSKETRLVGWGARNRTWEWRNQNPLPYRLATPHQSSVFGGFCVILQLFWAAPQDLSPDARRKPRHRWHGGATGNLACAAR